MLAWCVVVVVSWRARLVVMVSSTPPHGPADCGANSIPTVEVLRERWQNVQQLVAAAARAAGRAPEDVSILPVSKTYPQQVIAHAVAAGMRQFGENRPQELASKAQACASLTIGAGLQGDGPAGGVSGVPEFVQIGQLQSNKAKLVAAHAVEFQALDSLKVAAALEKKLAEYDRTLSVLVQVNTSREPQKAGISPSEAQAFFAELASFPHLRPRGLMTVAVNSPDPEDVRGCFRLLREVQADLGGHVPAEWLGELSMGMSGDFDVAIAEGSTCVRIGQAIFGPRATRPA